MAGYNGYAMSNNAVSAYENGEKPISKWTKAEMLYELKDANAEIYEAAKKLTAAEMRFLFLKWSSWHHTSSRYNRTEFYMFNYSDAEKVTNEQIATIIANREPKQPKEKIKTITAEITYDVWTKSGRYFNKKTYTETVTYKSDDKMVLTKNGGNKRLSSLRIKVIAEK
jgi:hypothetical protein